MLKTEKSKKPYCFFQSIVSLDSLSVEAVVTSRNNEFTAGGLIVPPKNNKIDCHLPLSFKFLEPFVIPEWFFSASYSLRTFAKINELIETC